MPRTRQAGAPDPKKRSRNGCWPCKKRKVKCGEERPGCENCKRQGETCDYSIRLNWNGRGSKSKNEDCIGVSSGVSTDVILNGGSSDISSPESLGIPVMQAAFHSNSNDCVQHGNGNFMKSRSNHLQYGTSQGYSNNESQSTNFQIAGTPGQHEQQHHHLLIDSIVSETVDPGFAPSRENEYHFAHSQNSQATGGNLESTLDHLDTTTSTQQAVIPTSSECLSHMNMVSSSMEPRLDSLNTIFGGDVLQNRLPYTTTNHLLDTTIGEIEEGISQETPDDYQRSHKRVRFNIQPEQSTDVENMLSTSLIADPSVETPSLINQEGSTITPYTPPVTSEGSIYMNNISHISPFLQDTNGIRCLPVNSLLSGPPGISPKENAHNIHSRTENCGEMCNDGKDEMTFWGMDHGLRDFDMGKNDDINAISGDHTSFRDDQDPNEFNFGTEARETSIEGCDYYASPIQIAIPRSFEPLPETLLSNPMNLLYFHFFITHTARVLIPHHCKANPLTHILPHLSLHTPNLLHLLLAYSAIHRSRLLNHPPPTTRIALWVQNIFPQLRHVLSDPREMLSNTNLATAIMLASLEIISPGAFEISVPWQLHLDTARQMIEARRAEKGGKDGVFGFLRSWWSYLDVIGSLSGGGCRNGIPSSGDHLLCISEEEGEEKDGDYQIECVLGFTSHFLTLLSKIATLAHQCDIARYHHQQSSSTQWQPSQEIHDKALTLETSLKSALLHHCKPCPHIPDTPNDLTESLATNEAFHLAGLIHLRRRILGMKSCHHDVQCLVGRIMEVLANVRKGGVAEACLLWPIFTVGCEIGVGVDGGLSERDKMWREEVLGRLRWLESGGMAQMGRARGLIEKVWARGHGEGDGRSLNLAEGEFLG